MSALRWASVGWPSRGVRQPGGLPYGYRIGADGRPEIVDEAQASVVRRIFDMYVSEGIGSHSIAIRLTDEGVPTQTGKRVVVSVWVCCTFCRNATYRGTWIYGKYRHVATEDGVKLHEQPREAWIEIPIPQLIDDETWERAQSLKKHRSTRSKRNTKVLYLLQHLLKCGECGHRFHAKSTWGSVKVRNGKRYRYDYRAPHRYYKCGGMHSLRLRVSRAAVHPCRAVGGADMGRGEASDPGPCVDRGWDRALSIVREVLGWRRRSFRPSEMFGALRWKRPVRSGCTCLGRSRRVTAGRTAQVHHRAIGEGPCEAGGVPCT